MIFLDLLDLYLFVNQCFGDTQGYCLDFFLTITYIAHITSCTISATLVTDTEEIII